LNQWTGANGDIYVLPLDGAHTPRPLIATRFNEQYGMFSPDGKWLAFVSNESGNDEVYVQPFGREGLRSVVSTGGGVRPMWSHDGKSLDYSVGDAVMQVVFDPATGNIGQGHGRRPFATALRDFCCHPRRRVRRRAQALREPLRTRTGDRHRVVSRIERPRP
jgi:hypothetical protein